MHLLACRWDATALDALLDIEGADVTLLVDEWEAANRDIDSTVVDRLAAMHVVPGFSDMPALAALAGRLREQAPPVDAVISLAEYSQLGAAYLATALGLAEPAVPTSILVRDKRAMKDAARAAGVPCARQHVLGGWTEPELQAVGDRLGWPLVVKPLDGMGTVDTWVVDDAAEAARHLATVDAATAMVAEEYIRGDEYHVDAVWRDGEPVELGVGRYPIPRVQITAPGHLNGSALLRRAEHAELYEQLTLASRQVNQALGIRNGITHTEFFHTADGRWVFSETATRPGGGTIPEVFGYFGDDLRRRWLLSLFGDPSRIRRGEPSSAVFGWCNLAPDRAGRVRVAPDEAALRALPFVTDVRPGHRAGDVVATVHPSTWSWQVFFGADSFEEFVQRHLEVERHARFEVEDLG